MRKPCKLCVSWNPCWHAIPIIPGPFIYTSMRLNSLGRSWPKPGPKGCGNWRPEPGTWFICLRISSAGSAVTPTHPRATRMPLRPTKITSRSAARRASIRWPTTRTIFTFYGTRPPWRDAAVWPSKLRANQPQAFRRVPGARCRFCISFWWRRFSPTRASGNGT